MDGFIRERNIERFSARLQSESDPAVRMRLRHLLLEEENKFAARAERLDQAERYVADCKLRISRQCALIDQLKSDGHDSGLAERLLNNLVELHDLFASYRQVAFDGLDRLEP